MGEVGRPATFLEMIRQAEAWLLLVCTLALSGGGLILSSSLSQILTAGGVPSTDINVIAQSLFSTGNMLGRLTCMIPSDALVRVGVPRPLFLLPILVGMAISHGSLAM